jgi:hypothetical protein
MERPSERLATRVVTRTPGLDSPVWPANLPAGARWLPYNPEPMRVSPTFLTPVLPAPAPARGRRLPMPYWRLLAVAAVVAGLVGILGGILAGMILGAR